MRVLSVSNFFDTHGGGLERVAGHLCREFARAGHDAAWSASDADGLPVTPAEIVALRCANPTERLTGLPMPIPGPRSLARLNRAVRGGDGVVIHDALYVTSIAAMVLARLRRKPVVLIQHIGSIQFRNPLLRQLMKLANALVTAPMMAAADEVVFISQTVREELAGSDTGRSSRLLFNGIDHDIFHASPREPAAQTRSRWGLCETGPLAIFVGRFVEKKGLSVIRALAAVRPDVQFALCGKGPIDPAAWQLPNVHVLGQQSQERLADLYRAGNVLMLPSVGEGYPLVVQEAMACGLPVLCGEGSAAADPAASRWLCGIHIDLADVTASAERCGRGLESLLSEPPDRLAMARHAATHYNWGVMASGVIDSLVAGRCEARRSEKATA